MPRRTRLHIDGLPRHIVPREKQGSGLSVPRFPALSEFFTASLTRGDQGEKVSRNAAGQVHHRTFTAGISVPNAGLQRGSLGQEKGPGSITATLNYCSFLRPISRFSPEIVRVAPSPSAVYCPHWTKKRGHARMALT